MTYQRIATFSAEPRVLTDFFSYGQTSLTVSNVLERTGSYAYRMQTATDPQGVAPSTPVSAIRMNYWIHHTSPPPTHTLYWPNNGSGDFSSTNLRIYYRGTDGLLVLRRPSGYSVFEELATAPAPPVIFGENEWFTVGVTHKIAGVDGFVSLFVNGERVLHYEGDTLLTGQTTVSSETFSEMATASRILGIGSYGGSGLPTSYLDDYYIDAGDGSEADAPPPARRFGYATITGAGANAEFTPVGVVANWDAVDDTPHDSDASYNKALATGLRDTFVFTDPVPPADYIPVAVIPIAAAKRLDSDSDVQLRFHAYDGANYVHGSDQLLPMSYGPMVWDRLTTAPDGGPWTHEKINAAQFGYESRGTFT